MTTKHIKKYRVIKGIFINTVFNGSIVGDRVWNEDSYGQSYPIENCEVINEFIRNDP